MTIIVFTCAKATIYQNEQQSGITSIEDETTIKDISTTKPRTLKTSPYVTASNHNCHATLPSSLQIIDESAFEGTRLVTVDIPASVSYIGDYAFAKISTLIAVRIPDNTKFIGKNAFDNSKQVILTASFNSYARTWAKENGFRFHIMATLSARDGVNQSLSGFKPGSNIRKRNQTKTENNQRTNTKERRTGRTIGELKTPCCRGVATLYVQSRYFP